MLVALRGGSAADDFHRWSAAVPGRVGPNFNAPQGRNTRRFEVVEALSWQKGTHRLKFGGDLNPTRSIGLWGFCTPMCVGAFSPTYLKNTSGSAALFPTTPATVTNAYPDV